MLQKMIVAMLFRRVVGYLGVGGVVGLENDVAQLGGLAAAAGTLAWSLWIKVQEHRQEQAAQRVKDSMVQAAARVRAAARD